MMDADVAFDASALMVFETPCLFPHTARTTTIYSLKKCLCGVTCHASAYFGTIKDSDSESLMSMSLLHRVFLA